VQLSYNKLFYLSRNNAAKRYDDPNESNNHHADEHDLLTEPTNGNAGKRTISVGITLGLPGMVMRRILERVLNLLVLNLLVKTKGKSK